MTAAPSCESLIGEWLLSGDTGLSSQALAAAMLGAREFIHERPHYPSDCWDFGRCIRLVRRVNRARGYDRRIRRAIDVLSFASPEWRSIFTHWDELERLHDAIEAADKAGDFPVPSAPSAMNARMREIIYKA